MPDARSDGPARLSLVGSPASHRHVGNAADCRTAVGRAYYAVFNVAADHLRKQGFVVGKGAAAHGEVQKCLSNADDITLAAVASELNKLHTLRNRADYQLGPNDVEKQPNARKIVAMAGSLIVDLDAKFGGTQSGLIRDAIEKWRRLNGYP